MNAYELALWREWKGAVRGDEVRSLLYLLWLLNAARRFGWGIEE